MSKQRSDFYTTDDEFKVAVANSTSIRQTLLALNLCAQGGSYRVFRRRVADLGLDTSHFTGKASNRGRKFGPKRPIEVYLTKHGEFRIQSTQLRKRLIAEKLKEARCD